MDHENGDSKFLPIEIETIPTKRQKKFDENLCIICQEVKKEPLLKLCLGISTLLKISERFDDGVYQRLTSANGAEFVHHRIPCYSNYTSHEKVCRRKIKDGMCLEKSDELRTTRTSHETLTRSSMTTDFDYKNRCVICGNKSYKKRHSAT